MFKAEENPVQRPCGRNVPEGSRKSNEMSVNGVE